MAANELHRLRQIILVWLVQTSLLTPTESFPFCSSRQRVFVERRVAATTSSFSADFGGSQQGSGDSSSASNITGAATEFFSELVLSEEPDEVQESVNRKTRALARSRASAAAASASASYRVSLSLSSPIGVTVCEVGPQGSFIYDRQMDLGTLQISSRQRAAPAKALSDEEATVLSESELKALASTLDANYRGLVVTAIDPNSQAWKQNVRPGDVLQGVSATLGNAVWPKSTLEGVRSAVSSRRLTSTTVDLQLSRRQSKTVASTAARAAESQFELTLTRPIGLLLKETDEGRVQVAGLSEIAPKLVQYAVRVGDYVVAVDSSIGDRMWPVSTVEGVISACTSRLPGQSITMRFERPEPGAAATEDRATLLQSTGAAVALTAPPATDASNKKLLSRCRDVLKRYVKEDENSLLFVQSKFRGKYALPAIVADKVVDALATAEAALDCVTLSMVMDAYLSCRQPERALQVFDAATGFSSDASVLENGPLKLIGRNGKSIQPNDAALNLVTGTVLLKAHAMLGDVHAVARVLSALEGRSGTNVGGQEVAPWPWTGTYGSIQPDAKLYNIALAAFESIGGDEALRYATDVFDRLPEPGFGASTSGPPKDLVSFNTMISILGNEGRSAEAFALFDKMKRSGSQALRPDKYTFTSLIKSVSNQDDIQELLYDMRERGVEPDCVTYNTMIKALCETKRWTQATRLVTEMESRGVAPDSMTYGYLMNAMLKTGKPNACLALFESACASPRTSALTENIYLYTTAITAASMLGDYERALELVSRMTALGIRPNMKTLTAVMGACLSSGRPDLASQLFQRMDNPDGYAMAQGIQALCASGRLDSAMELLRQQQRGVRAVMTGKDLMRSYHAVLKAALDGSDFDMARSAVADLFSKGYIPSRSIVLTVTDMMKIGSASTEESVNDEEALQQQQFSFGLFLIDRTVARNLPVDSRLYTSVLAFAARQGGLYRKVANLMMESKASVGGSGATSKLLLSVAVTDKDDDSAGTILDESWSATTGATIPSTWDDLFLNYDSYKKSLRDEESSSQRLLPSLPVRVTSRDVPRVLRAEQVVSSRNKKASSSSSSSSSSSAEPRNLSSQSRLAVS